MIEPRFGMYVGKVEYNQDPFNWARVQVRVDEIHGNPAQTPSHLLPWARLIQFGGGYYDGGSITVPPVGSTVAVVFEHGDVDLPYVIGGVAKKPTSSMKYGSVESQMGEWESGDEVTDVPKEARSSGEKHNHVIFKTPKGASIVVSEEDGNENFRLIDRSGQMLEMVSKVSASDNDGNSSQRGNSVAPTGIGASKVSEGYIQFIDLEGQIIKLDFVNKEITILSQGDLDETAVGDKMQTIGGEKVEDITGGLTRVVGGDKTQTLSGSETKVTSGNKDETIIGTRIVNTGNDNLNVLGNRAMIVQGTHNSYIVGSDIQLKMGAWTVTTILGVTISSLAGSITLSAPAGSIILTSSSGSTVF